jgi:hypothetical protein
VLSERVDQLIVRAEIALTRASIAEDREMEETWLFIAECFAHLARLNQPSPITVRWPGASH